MNINGQTDTLAPVNSSNAVVEGAAAVEDTATSPTVKSNVTQILRKVVKVSDTANALANYGRGRELQYQMEKRGKEIKRDFEAILLSAQVKVDGDGSTARKTAGFQALVAASGVADTDTGAVVNKTTSISAIVTGKQIGRAHV